MQGKGIKWMKVFSPGYPKLKQIFESLTFYLSEELPDILEFLMEQSQEVIDNPISGIFAGMIMTGFINELYGQMEGVRVRTGKNFEDLNSHEKLLRLFEAMMINGGETIIVSVIVKVIELMKDRIMEHESFDVVIYCKQ